MPNQRTMVAEGITYLWRKCVTESVEEVDLGYELVRGDNPVGSGYNQGYIEPTVTIEYDSDGKGGTKKTKIVEWSGFDGKTYEELISGVTAKEAIDYVERRVKVRLRDASDDGDIVTKEVSELGLE